MESLPFTDQRFMRHLGAVLVQRDQTRFGECVQYCTQLRRFGGLAYQFIQCGSTAGICCPFTQLGKPQEYFTCQVLLLSIQLICEDAFGGLCDRTAHTTRGSIPFDGKCLSTATLPCSQQCMREQWQRARFWFTCTLCADVLQ